MTELLWLQPATQPLCDTDDFLSERRGAVRHSEGRISSQSGATGTKQEIHSDVSVHSNALLHLRFNLSLDPCTARHCCLVKC